MTNYTDTKTIVERTAQNIAANHIRKLTAFDGVDIGDELYDQATVAFRNDISKALEASDNTAEAQAVRERLAEIVEAIRAGLPTLTDLEKARAEIAGLTAANQRLLDRLHNATPDLVTAQQRADQAEDHAAELAKQVEELRGELTTMREKASKTEREQALVVEFNSRHLIGTPVRYWKGAREGDGKTSKTRTGAQMLSGHTAVVWVEGEGACIALSHIEPLATTAEVA